MGKSEIRCVNTGRAHLAYREWGHPDNPPMVLLHGLALTSLAYWQPLVARFDQQYRIVAFDLLGHGDSDRPMRGYAINQQADELVRAMNLIGVKDPTLIGHSLGGVIASQITLSYPQYVQRLVLSNVPLPGRLSDNVSMFARRFPPGILLTYGLLMIPGVSIVADRLPRRITVRRMLQDLKVVYDPALLTADLVEQSSRNSLVAIAADIYDVILKPNLQTELPAIEVPTLLIGADSDLFVPVETSVRCSQLIRNAKLVILQQSGHYSLLDRPDEFNLALRHFFDATA